MAETKGKLVNNNTRFSKFTWGECPELRRAIQEVREKMAAEGKPLPIRFKIRLGEETREEKITEDKE